jgi:lipopolysaccharide export system protein LptA
MTLKLLLSSFFVFLLSLPALAEEPAVSSSSPVNITADALEYHEADKTYVARGHAEIVQGTVTLKAAVITAHFVVTPDGKTEVTQALAEGGVEIVSGDNKVTGERGIYEVARGVAVLKGGELRLTTPQDVVTARDSLEYWEKDRVAVARGNAVAVRGDKRVEADVLTAALEENAQKQLEVRRLGADGNVVITTPAEIARGDKGVYDVAQQKAVLDGNVRLTRGQNQLNGARAEVNMATGVSRLLSGGGRRVSGLIVPKDAPEVQ